MKIYSLKRTYIYSRIIFCKWIVHPATAILSLLWILLLQSDFASAGLPTALENPTSTQLTENYLNYLKDLSSMGGCGRAIEGSSQQKRPFHLTGISEVDILFAIQRFGPGLVDRISRQAQALISKSLEYRKSYESVAPGISPYLSLENGQPYELEKLISQLENYKREAELLSKHTGPNDPEFKEMLGQILGTEESILGIEKTTSFIANHPEEIKAIEMVNRTFQSIDLMALFFTELMTSAFVSVSKYVPGVGEIENAMLKKQVMSAEFGSTKYNSLMKVKGALDYMKMGERSASYWMENIVMEQLESLAEGEGWERVADLSGYGYDKIAQFFNNQQLFRDKYWEGAPQTHSRDAHLLQSVLISLVFNQVYGKGSAQNFFSLLATEEGQGLWILLFDRPPVHNRDFRSPGVYVVTGFIPMLGLK